MRLLSIKILFMVCLMMSLAGCETLSKLGSGSSALDDEYADWSAEQLYNEAIKTLDKKNYNKAIKLYSALESRYPFGPYAAQAQLDIAYAYYKNLEPEAAIASAERFIKIHPRNPSVDYAYYLIALVNYNRGFGFLDRFLPTDSSQRDPANTLVAYDNFAELIRRFPESQYAPDAEKRMIALRNSIAMYEVHVARFYIQREAYVAAANRASYVIENYQRTPAVPYALQAMEEAYNKLGLTDMADDAAKIYALNYPDGPPVKEFGQSDFAHKVWYFLGFDR